MNNTVAIPSLNVEPGVFDVLNILAEKKGQCLKSYLESVITEQADDAAEAELYKWLVKTEPEGLEILSDEEQAAFEKEMETWK